MEQSATPAEMKKHLDNNERAGRTATKLDGSSGINWDDLLGRSTAWNESSFDASFCHEKVILITGAGGSIGAALTMCIANSQPRLLVLLDSSEHNLYLLEAQLLAVHPGTRYVAVVGNVADAETICSIFGRYEPQLIFHAAAYKHVPLMEYNPFAAMQNNALGTYRIAQTALEHGPNQILMVSTDKAAEPASIMGVSKRIAEIVLQTLGNGNATMNSLRLGNVLGSQGSVVPYFLKQISCHGTVTVTDSHATRFFFTMQETISLILEASAHPLQSRILAPVFGAPIKVVDLAKFLIAQSRASQESIKIEFTGLRPGEKLVEQFIARQESAGETISSRLTAIETRKVPQDELRDAMMKIDQSIRKRDLQAMLEVIRRLVPGYHPSATVLAHPAPMETDVHD